MTTEPLSADLDLNVTSALSNVDELGTKIDTTLSSAGSTFTDAMDAAIASIPPVDVQINADATQVPTDIQNAVDAAGNPTVPIDADADAVPGDIQAAIDAVGPSVVPIDGDTTAASDSLSTFKESAAHDAVTVPVEADTSAADASLQDFAANAEEAGSAASSASDGVGHMAQKSEALSGAVETATGNLAGLSEASSALGEQSTGVVLATTTLATGIGELVHKGIEAQSASQTFTSTLGGLSTAVQSVHVGNLNTTLDDLAAKLGDTTAQMQTAIARGVQFAVNAGASRDAAANFSQELYVLAGRAVSMNQSLGSVSDVALQMEAGLGRARSASNLFQISISQNEINTRALTDSQKENVSQLTTYDKSLAAAEIAIDRYGGKLKGTIEDGANNAALGYRRLTAGIQNFIEEEGKPLVAPAFDVLGAVIPVVEDLTRNLGSLASVTLPALASILNVVGPALGPLLTGFAIFEGFTRIIGPSIALLAGGLEQFAIGLGLTGAAAETAAGGVAGLSATLTEMEASTGIGLFVVLAGAAASALGLFGSEADASAQQLTSFSDAVTTANGKLDDSVTKAAVAVLKEAGVMHDLAEAGVKIPDVLTGISSTSERTRNDIGELVTELQHMSDAGHDNATMLSYYGESNRQAATHVDRLVESIKNSDPVLGAQLEKLQAQGKLSGDAAAAIQSLIDKYDKGTSAAKDLKNTGIDPTTDAIQNQVDATSGLTKQQEDAVAAFSKAADAQNKLRDAYNQANDAILAELQSTIDVERTQRDASDAAATYAQKAKDAADAGGKNAQKNEDAAKALNDAEDAALRAAEAAGKKAEQDTAGASAAEQNAAKTNAQITSLEKERDTLDINSPLRRNLDEYIARLLNVPPDIITNTDTPGLEAAIQHYQDLKNLMDYLATHQALVFTTQVAGATAALGFRLGAEGGVFEPQPGGVPVIAAEAGHTEVLVSAGNTREQNLDLLRRGGLGDLLAAPLPRLAGVAAIGSQGAAHIDNSVHTIVHAEGQEDPTLIGIALSRRQRADLTARAFQ